MNNENQLMVFSDPVISTVEILEVVQVNILFFIKADQLIISHMFQVQSPNVVLKVSRMQHTLQEWIEQTSGF